MKKSLKSIVLFMLSISNYLVAYEKPSLRFFGTASADYVNFLIDPAWKDIKNRHYKGKFLSNGFSFRQAQFGFDLKFRQFNLLSDFEITDEGELGIGNLYFQFRTLSKNFEALLGQFYQESCNFNSDANKEKPYLELPASQSFFYEEACKGLGSRVRYRKYYWAAGSSFNFPEIKDIKFEEYSANIKLVISPLKMDVAYLHFDSSFLWQKTDSVSIAVTPGVQPREKTQADVIRTGELPSNSVSRVNFSLQGFFIKALQFESNYMMMLVSSREENNELLKNLLFPSIDAGIFYHFGLRSFHYDPFKGFYEFKPTRSKIGIFQVGLSFQLIDLLDGSRNFTEKGKGGVEGGTQLIYMASFAWKYNRHLKVAFNYFITQASNAKSVENRGGKYKPEDWLEEKNRPISGFALRTSVSF